MSMTTLRRDAACDSRIDRIGRSPLRWTVGFLLIGAMHVGAAWIGLYRPAPERPAPASAPVIVMIDLQPLPAAPPSPPSEAPPGPQQTVSQPPPPPEDVSQPLWEEPAPLPSPEVEQPLPQAQPSPAPDVVVPIPVPPKPPPKPLVRSRLIEHSLPKRLPDKMPPAPGTRAPPAVEVPPAAAAAADAPGAPRAQPSKAVPAWQGLLVGRLEQFKRYPYEAQYRRQQGVAYLHFTMDRNGKVLSARIARSSGYEALDRETLALVHRAEPLPKPPPEVPGEPIYLTVPIQFFLR